MEGVRMSSKIATRDEVGVGMQELAGKYLTFALADEEYGIGILKVREIIGLMEITAVPQTPPYVKGVINLRGRVIPVIELRTKFGMKAQEYTDRTCIIVVEVSSSSEGTIQVGVLVDSVSEVLNITAEEIEPPPSFGNTQATTNAILGMAKIKGDVKILLDVNSVVSEGLIEKFSGM